ncbi:MAG: SWIM zinc finger family protein [Verrucomicrobiales bacterium]|nr:SWIM zinc finger family protein [Verrucomicrobiales bacterium]
MKMKPFERQFRVQGSAATPYTVRITYSDGNFRAYCDCQAGQNGLLCKHRTSIILGNAEGLVSGSEDLDEVRSWAKESNILEYFAQLETLERQESEIKAVIKTLRKQIGRELIR